MGKTRIRRSPLVGALSKDIDIPSYTVNPCMGKTRIRCIPNSQNRPREVGGGGTLIISYIRRLGSFFWLKILNFKYFWGVSEKEIFFGYEDFVDIFFFWSSQN